MEIVLEYSTARILNGAFYLVRLEWRSLDFIRTIVALGEIRKPGGSMAKIALNHLADSSRNENLCRLFHTVTWIINSEVASNSTDLDFLAVLGLLQSHLIRCYAGIVQDPMLVDWSNSQLAIIESLDGTVD